MHTPHHLHVPFELAAAASINRIRAAELEGFPLLHYMVYLLYTSRSYSHRINYYLILTLFTYYYET